MNIIKSVCSLALTGFFLWLPVANATDTACEGCSAPQMSAQAKSMGKGDHRIYSLSTGAMRGYSVTCSGSVPAGNTGSQSTQGMRPVPPSQTTKWGSCPFGRSLQVDSIPLDNQTQSAWSAITYFYNQNGQKLSRVDIDLNADDLPDGGPYLDSVYPMLSDYQARMNLYDYILANSHNLENYRVAVQRAVVAAVGILPYEIVVELTFKDGSKVKLKSNASTQELTQVPNTARAINGTAIIEHNTSEYQGNFPTDGMNVGDYVNYLRSMGVEVTNGGTQGVMACVAVGDELTCTIRYVAQ